jgi:hypothetical protein
MTIVLNSSTGITTPPVTVLGDTSGSITLVAPAVAGTNTQTLLAATGTLAPTIKGTAQTSPPATAQYFDFTGIPSWVSRITIMFSGIGTNGTSNLQIQGGSGSIEITGYISSAVSTTGTVSTSTTGLAVTGAFAATDAVYGKITLDLVNSNAWVSTGLLRQNTGQVAYSGGGKTFSGTLDRIRITTVGGANNFNAGSINVLYE